MDKSKIKTLITVLIVGYIVFLGASYAYLKFTVKWPEVPADSTAAAPQEQGLNLTWDISGKTGPVSAVTQEQRDQQMRDQSREDALAIADSAVATQTAPITTKLEGTQEQLASTRQQVNELERLISLLATQADSVDESNAARLSKIVEQMKPADAAAILNRLGDKANAEMLLKMKQRQAARILAAMPRERAAEVAKYLSRAYARSSI